MRLRYAFILLMAAGPAFSAPAQEPSRTGAPAGWPMPLDDTPILIFLQADRAEYRISGGDDSYLWDTQGWIGTDRNKFWTKIEGEGSKRGGLDVAQFQALYSRMVTSFFDLQGGLRQDVGPGPSRTYAVLGLQGLAPYFLELDSALFLSDKGDLTARIEAEYDLLITQRLIGQTRVELDFAAQHVKELGIGAGLSAAELGFRLRYEMRREIAPYIGVSWVRAVGDSADFTRAEGRDPGTTSFVLGVRLWF